MKQAFSKYKWIIAGAIIIILVFVLYAMLKPEAKSADGIERTIVSIPGGDGSITGEEDPAAGFIQQLLAIKQVHFNAEFFQDPVYKELVDQYRPLDKRPVGRPNPFLNIGVDGVVFSPDAAPAGSATPAAGAAAGTDGGFVQTSSEDNIPE